MTRDNGPHWVFWESHWTIADWDGYLWSISGRVVRVEKVGHYVGSC
jgi:hypothetical protein